MEASYRKESGNNNMEQYEYETLTVDEHFRAIGMDLRQALNLLGGKGWQVVGVISPPCDPNRGTQSFLGNKWECRVILMRKTGDDLRFGL